MDHLLEQFYMQYLQQVTDLRFPPSRLLAHPDIQQQLVRYFFDASQDSYLPPPPHQRKVLKRLVSEIIKEAKDEDDEVSDGLMEHMGHLSSLPNQSDSEIAQTPRILSYFVPDSSLPEVTTSTLDNTNDLRVNGMISAQRVLIRESPQLLAAGSNVGLRTWEACLRLAYYLCTSPARSSMKGANVLELGAGTGLLSLICSVALETNRVLATDGLTHVVDGIEGNISLNKDYAASSGTKTRLPTARILDWTDLSNIDDALSIDGKAVNFDYILGADITYHPELLDPLASLLSKMRDRFPACRILISGTVRNENTFKLWKETCFGHGLVIREVNEKEDQWQCPQYRLQAGLFHEQAFPIVIMDITK